MKLWQDGAVAMLAAIGLGTVLWLAVRAILFSTPLPRQEALLLLPARGDCCDLEQQLRALTLLTGEKGAVTDILVVNCGVSAEGEKLCRALEQQMPQTTFCQPEQLPQYLSP